MKKSAYLILGSCLALQMLPPTHTSGADMDMTLNQQIDAADGLDAASLPFYGRQHASELLDEVERDSLPDSVMQPTEVARYIHKRTRELLPRAYKNQSRKIARALIDTANRYQMDPIFLMAVVRHESRFNPAAKGGHGEIGLMQIKPSTAHWIISRRDGKKAPSVEKMQTLLKDPVVNIRYGTAYLAHLRERFNKQGRLYLSAYNMGAGRVRSHLKSGVEPRIYSDKVMARYAEFNTGLFSKVNEPKTRPVQVARVESPTLGL